jgi:NADH:ubiquinone reductase (H+-translocating)
VLGGAPVVRRAVARPSLRQMMRRRPVRVTLDPAASEYGEATMTGLQPGPDGQEPTGGRRRRILVLGTGFAGYHCLRELERRLPADSAELVAVNPTDYMLYVPLLPEVAAGILDPRRVAIPLRESCPRTHVVPGTATSVDLAGRTCTVLDVEGRTRVLDWDRLVLACGSVTRLLSVPGVAEHALGFKSIPEALYLRDHILGQLELAEQTEDPEDRQARTTFVVVGAGYTGTEVAAQCASYTADALRRYPGLRDDEVRWILLDLAPRVLPGLNERLSGPAQEVLRRRGVDVRLRTSVESVTPTCARLSDGSEIPTRTVVWCVGVYPDPLVATLALPTSEGRLKVDEYLTVPGQPDVLAAGDAAAVPDLAHPGRNTPMTAQHAERQGRVAAVNVAASLGFGHRRRYKHRDLGFVVDLGGRDAVADPLRVPLSGFPAKLITSGYHLLAMPAWRMRVLSDWINAAVGRRQLVQLGLVPRSHVTLADADRPVAADGRPARAIQPSRRG